MTTDSYFRESQSRNEERELLRNLISADIMTQMNLPPAIEAAYLADHERIAVEFILKHWHFMVWLILIIATLLVLLELVPPPLVAQVATVVGSLAFLLAIVIASTHSRLLRPHLRKIRTTVVVLVLLLMMWPSLFVPPNIPFYAVYICVVGLTSVAVFTFSWLPFRQAGFAYLLANIVFFGLLIALKADAEWQPLFLSAAAGGLVGLIGGIAQEIRDRMVFLQGRALLLEHEVVNAMTKHLEQLSRVDSLTGLTNRRHFDEVLTREWAICRRESRPVGLLFIDVDHFKNYNDRYGHPAGDACLTRVARVLSTQLSRASDVIARYGGEEFVVILPRTEHKEVLRIAERLLKEVDALGLRHEASSCSEFVSISIGAAVLVPSPDTDANELIKQADNALYEAKRAGRQRVVFSTESPSAGV